MPRKRENKIRTEPNNLTINVTPELCSQKIMAGFPQQYLSPEEVNNEFIKRLLSKASINDSKITSRIAYVNDLVSLDLFSITPSQYKSFLNFLESMSCNVYEDTIDVKYLPRGRIRHISIAISLVTAYPLILKVLPEHPVLPSEAGLFAPKKQQTAEIPSATPALNEEDSIEPVSFWLCTLV